MFDPWNPKDVNALHRAIKAAYAELDQYRKRRTEILKEYVGAAYSDAGSDDEMPVNLMALTVDIYMMYLAGNRPQVILPTANKEALIWVADLEAIVNHELENMNFDRTLRRWVLDAFFLVGIIKTGLVDGPYVELIPGEPQPSQDYFCDIVDFDDFVYDTRASSWDRVTFLGDCYKADYEAVMDAEDLDSKAKATVKGSDQEDPLATESDRADDIGRGGIDTDDINDFKKQVRLWDICLPEERLVITLPDASAVSRPLKVVEWDSSSTSPYHILSFSDVPSNIIPLAPGMLLKSLNKSINALFRKLVSQAKRQKTLGLFKHGNQDDARRIRDARDGELVPVEHPDTVTEVNFGGPSQENLAFSMAARDWFSQLAGNLDALGGLGPQSDTVRQDMMISSTVSKKAAKMTREVVDATVKVIEDLIYRIHTDPFRTYQTLRPLGKTDFQLVAELKPGERHFALEDFQVKIDPYSMQYKSPQERAQEIIQIISSLALPMMPFLQQQGINLNTQALFEYLAKYLNLPELGQIFEFTGAPTPGTSSTPQQPRQSPVTHRTYERVNRPGATRQGNTQTLMQAAMGANPQRSQRDCAFQADRSMTSRHFRFDPITGKVVEVTRSVPHGLPRYPLPCETLAVHPTQIDEFREWDSKHGVPTDYRQDGTPLMRDARHYKRYRELYGWHQKNDYQS